jgi:hypothetical protein
VYRNLFLHREHIGAMARWLVVEERDNPLAPLERLQWRLTRDPDPKPRAMR